MSRRAILAASVAVLTVVGVLAWSARKDRVDPPTAPVADDPAQEELAAREAIRAQPNDPQARFGLARALRRLGRAKEAEDELALAIQAGLPEAQGQREVVLLMASRNWPQQMEGLFQRVLRDNPDDQELLLAVADSYSAKSRWASAESLYSRLIKLAPDQTELYFKRGVARMRLTYFATAEEDFRKVLAREPERYEARLFLGHSLLGDARMDAAARELEACRHQRPEAIEPLIGLAACAVERNDLGAAEALLTDAAKRDGDSPLVLQELASLYVRQMKMELAVATLRRLLVFDPNHRKGHLLLAQALLALGDTAKARKHEQIYEDLDRREEERLGTRRGMR